MKARAAVARRPGRPEHDLDELRGSGSTPTARSSSARWRRTTQMIAVRPRRGARPILGEVCAQIADVQVRNRGTIGGNVCSSDPTNHLPPLLVALGATFTMAGQDGERDGCGGGVLPRRLHDRRRAGRAADEDHRAAAGRAATASPPCRSASDGTCIVERGGHASNGGERVALGCVAATPVLVEAPSARSPRLSAARCARRPSSRLRTCTPRPTTGGTSPRSLRARAVEQAAERTQLMARPGRHDAGRSASRSTDDLRARGRGAAAADPLPPRRPRPDRHRTSAATPATAAPAACMLDGMLVKSCMLLAVQADGATIETVEGLAEDGELTRAAAGVLRPPRAPVRLLHARDADERDRAAAREPAARARSEITQAIQGNICRCTGYWNIVEGGRKAAVRPGGRLCGASSAMTGRHLVLEELEL